MAHKFLEWIFEMCPSMRSHVPDEEDLQDFSMDTRTVGGICTHPEAVDGYWVHSRGGKRFMTFPTPPEPFVLAGFQDRGGSEYSFFMWVRDGRKFWFYDQHAVFSWSSDASEQRTGELLRQVLERWESSTTDVIFSGIWGWFDPKTCRFEKDPDSDGNSSEDWDEPKRSGIRGMDRLLKNMLIDPDRQK